MSVYNVQVPVYALIEASSAEEAVEKLRAKIAEKGLVASDDKGDAFESEIGVEADF